MAKVEEQYAGGGAAVGGKGTGHFRTDRENIASAILGLGDKAAAADPVDLAVRRYAAQQETAASPLRSGT